MKIEKEEGEENQTKRNSFDKNAKEDNIKLKPYFLDQFLIIRIKMII